MTFASLLKTDHVLISQKMFFSSRMITGGDQGCSGAGTRQIFLSRNDAPANNVYHRRNAGTAAFQQISSGRGPIYYYLPKCYWAFTRYNRRTDLSVRLVCLTGRMKRLHVPIVGTTDRPDPGYIRLVCQTSRTDGRTDCSRTAHMMSIKSMWPVS